jgi:hypothetical protein
MADLLVRDVFNDECKNLAIDAKLAKRIHAYQVGFVNKNEEHITFFGGNLLGVQVVRFGDADRDRWFDDILDADDVALERRIHDLPNINPEFNVSSDVMNLSCIWLLHKLFNSKLPEKVKHEAMIDVMLVLQYKFFTSRLFRHFRYPADKAVAEATYAQLSNKFDIKVYGSWTALFRAKAESTITAKDPSTGKPSIHYQTIVKMDDDLEVVYFANDAQGRIRDMLKNLYNEFLKTHKQGTRISSVSSIVEHDGAEILKDRSKNLTAYTRYLHAIVTDKESFIHEELMTIICRVMHTMPPHLLTETLEWMSRNYRQSKAEIVEEVLDDVLIHAFDYLVNNRSAVKASSDLPGLISKLRGVYMSSRSTDPALLSLREKTEKIVSQATGKPESSSVVSSVRTGTLLYCVLRAFTMQHYTQTGIVA